MKYFKKTRICYSYSMNYGKKFLEKIESTKIIRLVILIIGIGLVLYWRAVLGSFVWDDKFEIVTNPVVQNISNLPYAFTGGTFSNGISLHLGGQYYRPLKTVTMAFLWIFSFGSPFVFHLFDITLHICNTVLLFILLKKIFVLQKSSRPQLLAFLLSLLFLVHPTQVESVALIASSGVVMYLFFLLSMLLLLFSGFEKRLSNIKIFFVELFLLGSLLSLEQGIIGFFLICIFTFLFLRKQCFKLLLFSLIPLGLYAMLRFWIAHMSLVPYKTYVPINVVPLWQRLLTIPFEFASYIGIILFPIQLTIYRSEIIQSVQDPRLLVSIGICIGVIALVVIFFARFKNKMFIFFLTWIILQCGMISNIFPLDMTIAERWLYGPLVALLAVIGLILIQVKNKKVITATIFVLIISVVFFSVRTFLRIGDWHDETTLFTHDAQIEKNSYALDNEYGVVLMRESKYTQAETVLLKSLELNPVQVEAYDNLGIVEFTLNRKDKAKAYFQLAMRYAVRDDATNKPFDNYAQFLLLTDSKDHALQFVLSSLKLYPWSPALNRIAAQIYYEKKDYQESSFYNARAGNL